MESLKKLYEGVGIGGLLGGAAAAAAGAVVATYYLAPERILGALNGLEASSAGLSKQLVTVGDWRWSYLEGGKSGKPVIVVVHGFSDASVSHVAFMKHFTKKYHVIIPDLPGHGETRPDNMSASYSVHEQVDRLHSFLGRVLPSETKYHIIGHSMGGNISGLYGVKYPDEVLTVGFICNGGVVGSNRGELYGDIDTGKRNWLISRNEKEFDDVVGKVYFKPPSVFTLLAALPRLKRVVVDSRSARSEINAKIWKDVYEELQHSLDDQLQNLHADTFILWGRQDKVLDVSQFDVMLAKLPKPPTYQLFDECGHTVLSDRLSESVDAYTKFLERSENDVLRRNIGSSSTIRR